MTTRNVAASLSGLDDRDIADVLAMRQSTTDALRGARILVTGATGWFGTWLLDALVALDRSRTLGLAIVAVSRDPEAFGRRHPALRRAAAITWATADVCEALTTVSGSFTHVIHAATDSSAQAGATGQRLHDTIVEGTRHVLDVAARSADTRVLLVSSGAVYGSPKNGLCHFTETDAAAPLAPGALSPYARGKHDAEVLAARRIETGGGHVSIARCFAFVGPHMPFDAHFAIGNFIRDAVDGHEVVVRGNGHPLRSYQYMSDLVIWLVTILVEGRCLRVYNVGSDDALSIADLARRTAALAGRPDDVRIVNGVEAGRDYVPDVARSRIELGLVNRVPLDDAIRRTQDWYRLRCPDGGASRSRVFVKPDDDADLRCR